MGQVSASDESISHYHPRPLIKSISYIQGHRLKKSLYKTSELPKNLKVLMELFVNLESNKKFLKKHITSTKVRTKRSKLNYFCFKYNRKLRNIKLIINKHWHLLQMNSNLRTAFEQELIIVYRHTKNLGYPT